MNKKQAFKLWLEYNPFDVAEPDLSEWDMENEFCNIGVDLLDGRYYGINVWTYKYVETAIAQDKVSGENFGGSYIIPPDLLVKDLTKECIEATISDLLSKGNLEQLLNPSVFNIHFKPPWTDANNLEDLGEALNQELKAKIPAGHFLYRDELVLLALRNDRNEIILQLDDGSMALARFNKGLGEEIQEVQLIRVFRNKEDLWMLQLKNDIRGIQD